MKRILSVLLLLSLLLSACSSSSGGSETEAPVTEAPAVTTASEETVQLPTSADERAATKDSLPEGLSFDGSTVRIYTRNTEPFTYEMGVETMDGEVVNDAIYNRNADVEERLSIEIEVDASAAGNGQDAIRRCVTSGDDVYTFCMGTSFHVPALALSGYYLNINDIEYIDLEKPWWVQDLRDEMTIYGQLYHISGDIALSLIQYTNVIYANMVIAENHDVENLYELVVSGKWTIDKLHEISKGITEDVNGDSVYNESDLFGFGNMDSANIFHMACAAGLDPSKKNSDGIPELTMANEHAFVVFDKLTALLHDDRASINNINGTYKAKSEVENMAAMQKMFMENHVLLFCGNLLDADALREMESDFEVLPLPKYDEAQENYMSFSRDSYSVIVIPKTLKNTDLAGAVCEALAAESYRKVTPAYVNVALKEKYTRETTTAELLDIILENITFDFAFANSYSMGYITHTFQNAIEQGEAYASIYETKSKAALKALEKKIIAYYEKHAD